MDNIRADQQAIRISMWTRIGQWRNNNCTFVPQFKYPKRLLTRLYAGSPFVDVSAADRQQAAYELCPNRYLELAGSIEYDHHTTDARTAMYAANG